MFTPLFLTGLLVFIAGRFHFLLRRHTNEASFSTTASNLLRFGSILLTIALWTADIILKGLASSTRH